MDKRLFGFLKDRKIFTGGGHRTLREYMDAKEKKTEFGDVSRRARRKAKCK